MTIEVFCEQRGMTTEELFVKAYEAERGFIFGLESPKQLHALWKKNNCVAPLYVYRFIKRTLDKEDHQQLVPL